LLWPARSPLNVPYLKCWPHFKDLWTPGRSLGSHGDHIDVNRLTPSCCRTSRQGPVAMRIFLIG
jgi:hypothetical protein